MWLCIEVLLCFLQWNRWSPYSSKGDPHVQVSVISFVIIGSLWLLLNDSVKSKLLSLFSLICLHGLMSVVGIGDLRIEARTFCTSGGLIW